MAAENKPEPPPVVAPMVRVGVTGHRLEGLRRDGFDEALLRSSIRKVLHLIQEIAAETHGARADGPPPALRLISPLAEGADRFVAQEALRFNEDGSRIQFELHCPFPFPRAEYEKDFPASRQEFVDLADRATAVLELNGSRETARQAYEAVGRLVLRQSDILIAIWDGEPPAGPGGTGQIVEEARSLEIPVVRIGSKPPHPVSLLGFGGRPLSRQSSASGESADA